jgi:transcriptional regulator with XRE-family HTH domain
MSARHPARMPMRRGPLTRGTERGTAIVRTLMREAEAARLASGTSYAAIARLLRISPAQAARIMQGRSPRVSIVRAAQVLEAVGLELSARAFHAGVRVRDVGQVRLLGRLRQRISKVLQWTDEVPVTDMRVPGIGDQRAWDAGVDGAGVRVRIDAETHVGDWQAVERRVALKQRDGQETCVILLLSDTKHHRALLAEAGDSLRARFPVSQRAALGALRDGRSPAGNAIVLL